MGINYKPLEAIEKDISDLYSRKRMDNAEVRSVKAGSNFIRNKIATNLDRVKDTGELAMGTDIRNPKKVGHEMIANIYWRGEHSTLAYINEMGHRAKDGSWVKPRGAGVVNTVLRYYSDQYFDILVKEMNKR